jgi:hypothetical protein
MCNVTPYTNLTIIMQLYTLHYSGNGVRAKDAEALLAGDAWQAGDPEPEPQPGRRGKKTKTKTKAKKGVNKGGKRDAERRHKAPHDRSEL